MAIDHEAHKIKVKHVSDKMNHPITYNDAGAPREKMPKVKMEKMIRDGEDKVSAMRERMFQDHGH